MFMIRQNEKCKATFLGGYKLNFWKFLDNAIHIYDTYIHFEGITIYDDTVSDKTTSRDVDLRDIKSVSFSTFKGKKCLVIKYIGDSIVGNQESTLYFFDMNGLNGDFNDCKEMVSKAVNDYLEKLRQQHLAQMEYQNELQRQKEESKEYYNRCLKFHIKDDTPRFDLYNKEEENKAVIVYINKDKSLNFLKVDGETKEEDVGVIPYEKIHYYEKAGNVHYVAETNGSYSSFGGSLTGATISKKAALFHGLMFGPMGMATAALMSYKPAQQKPAETHFELTSETKRIDERNVLLNFYSDERNQYIDIELPQEIYNFLQTHLPEKKYEIVSEVEKHAAVSKAVDDQKRIDAPQKQSTLPIPEKLSLDDFREKAEKLKIMKEMGLLSDEEFSYEKSKLLSLI